MDTQSAVESIEASADPANPGRDVPDAAFVSQVREALTRLYDPVFLETIPLARMIQPRSPTNSVPRGLVLRQSIVDAIHRLGGDHADGGSGVRSVGSRILALRFIDGLSPSTIQSRLAFSRSAYYRAEHQATGALTSLLWEIWSSSSWVLDNVRVRNVNLKSSGKVGKIPVPISRFVGRESEVADLVTRLRDRNGPRLITLTGAGGSGKTRLAVEVASRISHAFPDGVYQVELASRHDATLIGSTVATQFGVHEVAGQPIVDTLVHFLDGKRLLLIMDNCEHVIDETARLVESLAQACPYLRLMSTSREALRIPGEVIYQVPPLAVPSSSPMSLEQLESCDSVRLFTDRAAGVDRNFLLSTSNARAVAEICRRLDGLPLAIELAAARLDTLTIDQIASGMQSRFDLLTLGSRTSPSRHRNLQSLVRWSYDLLPTPEQALFRLLSIFPGSFDFESATEVAQSYVDIIEGRSARDGEPSPSSSPSGRFVPGPQPSHVSTDVLDPLNNLVTKSLVVVDRPETGLRFRLLETIGEFGRQELVERGELDLAKQSLARWASSLVGRAEANRRTARRGEWGLRLEVEHDNIQSALAWCVENDLERALALLATLQEYWAMAGKARAGLAWSDRTITVVDLQLGLGRTRGLSTVQSRLNYAHVLRQAGRLALSDNAGLARERTERSLLLCRQENSLLGQARAMCTLAQIDHIEGRLIDIEPYVDHVATIVDQLAARGDKHDAAEALSELGSIHMARANAPAATACFERLIRLSAASGDVFLIAHSHGRLAELYLKLGDLELARFHGEEALEHGRAIGYEVNAAWALLSLGNAARLQRDLPYAKTSLLDAIEKLRHIGHSPAVARALSYLGNVEYHLGDNTGSAVSLAKALAIARATRRPLPGWMVVLYSGLLEARLGATERAVEHLTAVLAHRDVSPLLLLTGDRLDCESALAAARELLGDEAYERAERVGTTESLESILDDIDLS